MKLDTFVPFGTFLVQQGVINEQTLTTVLAEQPRTRLRLGELLVEKKILSDKKLVTYLSKYLDIPSVNLFDQKIAQNLTTLLPHRKLVDNLIVPYHLENNVLKLAMHDPMNYHVIDEVRIMTGYDIIPVITSKEDIERVLNRQFSNIQENVEQMMQDIRPEELTSTSLAEETSPIAKTVNQFILQAYQSKASDIHIEPRPEGVHIRFRVDGIMRGEQKLPASIHSMLVARIKIMANMNVSERRLPQDGRIKVTLSNVTIELRISTLPTNFGEKVVLRLLGASQMRSGIQDLSMTPHNLERLKRVIHQPHGLVIVAGPTGSGKSTTLYSILASLDREHMNIVTVEDPIEQQIEGVTQSQVNVAIGYTFASGLRTILRQDPDVVMLGEIRDTETAEIAIRAAMTGHLVFSTIHTNSAVNSLSRLVDMGIAPFLVASSLECIISQRLVRRICPNCGEPHTPTDIERQFLEKYNLPTDNLRKGTGCFECGKTGYKGRIGIHEVLVLNEKLRSLIVQRASEEVCSEEATKNGLIFMREDGMIKVSQGLTTIDEILRVT